MGLVAAICTQCGASIQVDESKEAGICAHCGTAFITEKVINNYHIHNTTNVVNNIAHATINVKQGDDIGDFVKRYRAFYKQRDYASAVRVSDKMYSKFPDSAITYYCRAHLTLAVRYFDVWCNGDSNGSQLNEFFDGFSGDMLFNIDWTNKALDKFDLKSDADICKEFKKTKIDNPIDGKAFLRLIAACALGSDAANYAKSGGYDSALGIEDLCSDYTLDVYDSALDSAKRFLKTANEFVSDSDRALFADFISETESNVLSFEKTARRRKQAMQRLTDTAEKVFKDNKSRIVWKDRYNGHIKKAKIRNRLIAVLAVVAVVAIAVIIVIKVI